MTVVVIENGANTTTFFHPFSFMTGRCWLACNPDFPDWTSFLRDRYPRLYNMGVQVPFGQDKCFLVMNRNKFELRFHFLLAGQHTCYFRGLEAVELNMNWFSKISIRKKYTRYPLKACKPNKYSRYLKKPLDEILTPYDLLHPYGKLRVNKRINLIFTWKPLQTVCS